MLRFLLLLCCCSFALGASQLLTEKISLKNGDGTVIWSLKPQDDGGAKLLDANEQELARYTINANGKIVVKDAADTRLGTVEGEGGKYKFVGEVEGETHWVVQRRDDGDWKVEDGGERKLLKLSAKDYGWKAKNDAGEDFFKVKNKDGKNRFGGQTIVPSFTPNKLSPCSPSRLWP